MLPIEPTLSLALGALGVSLATIGRTLETMLGSRVVTTYIDRGREYNVILQGEDAELVSSRTSVVVAMVSQA